MKNIFFYNTEKREKVLFSPIKKNEISIYTCGPTLYDFAHIGNFRTYIFEDLLRKSLKYFFCFNVTQVMNLTDLDDKIIRSIKDKNVYIQEYTKKFQDEFFKDLKILNIEAAEYYPKATDYIADMITIIEDLLKKNIAYVGKDKSIYFSIQKYLFYGKLSHLDKKQLRQGASQRTNSEDEYSKNMVSDFVLWKAYDEKRDGLFYFESPFGKGRPGWHIECSAMALKILGNTIDIHCGGIDNIFPHHENEIAQSESYTNKKFVNYWMHSAHLIVNNKKMSKSLGNFYTLKDLINKGYTGAQVRFLFFQTHYRTPLNFTLNNLEGAGNALIKLQNFISRIEKINNKLEKNLLVEAVVKSTTEKIHNALADDLNTPMALSFLFDFIKDINQLYDQEKLNKENASEIISFLKKIDKVFSFLSFDENAIDIPSHIQKLVEQRNQARENKEWLLSDKIRKQINDDGYLIEDTKEKTIIKKK